MLRTELQLPDDYEFKFSGNSARVREAFFSAVAPYGFFFSAVVLNKDPRMLTGPGVKDPNSHYMYTCRLVFENIKPYLQDATVIVDRSGSDQFRFRLARYLRQRGAESGKQVIKILKVQDSHRNNLLQLADYVAGGVNRKVQGKMSPVNYRRWLGLKELRLQIWPQG